MDRPNLNSAKTLRHETQYTHFSSLAGLCAQQSLLIPEGACPWNQHTFLPFPNVYGNTRRSARHNSWDANLQPASWEALKAEFTENRASEIVLFSATCSENTPKIKKVFETYPAAFLQFRKTLSKLHIQPGFCSFCEYLTNGYNNLLQLFDYFQNVPADANLPHSPDEEQSF